MHPRCGPVEARRSAGSQFRPRRTGRDPRPDRAGDARPPPLDRAPAACASRSPHGRARRPVPAESSLQRRPREHRDVPPGPVRCAPRGTGGPRPANPRRENGGWRAPPPRDRDGGGDRPSHPAGWVGSRTWGQCTTHRRGRGTLPTQGGGAKTRHSLTAAVTTTRHGHLAGSRGTSRGGRRSCGRLSLPVRRRGNSSGRPHSRQVPRPRGDPAVPHPSAFPAHGQDRRGARSPR